MSETPRGEQVAWVEKRIVNGIPITDGISSIHRAMDRETYCGLPLPDADRRFLVLGGLTPCLSCLRLHVLGLSPDEVRALRIREAVEFIEATEVLDAAS